MPSTKSDVSFFLSNVKLTNPDVIFHNSRESSLNDNITLIQLKDKDNTFSQCFLSLLCIYF